MTDSPRLTAEEARRRLVRREDYVACDVAFIDCKMEGSVGKLNYSIIGPGVTQAEDQVVNLVEPHGFSLGVASMPKGVTNNLHVHYTAEVFIIFAGEWLFRWGPEGRDGELVGRVGDVISMPTWIFRGFTNIGDDEGSWIFSCLGGDDTGGVIWHPSILKNAAQHGLYLSRENMLVDVGPGGAAPAAETLITPMSDADMASLRRYTPEEFASRVVKADARRFSRRGLLDAVLPGHASELAPVIGPGMTQDRETVAPVGNPHGFSVEWLRIKKGQTVGPFRLGVKQVLLVREGELEARFNLEGDVTLTAGPRETLSVPAEVWRTLTALEDVEAAVVTAGDARARPEWTPQILAAAAAADWGLDPNGYVAPAHLLPPEPVAA